MGTKERERMMRIFVKAEQNREGWLVDQGASGNAVKIREGESEWWKRASYPNRPASQSYLNLFTTTASCRKSFCG